MKTKRPPGPKGFDTLRRFRTMGKTDPLSFWRQMHREYGDTIKLKAGPMDIWFFASPEAIYEVLVSKNKIMRKGLGYSGLRKLLGEGLITTDKTHWASQRKRLNPIFTPVHINGYTNSIFKACEAGILELQELCRTKTQVNLDHAMMRYTMRVVSLAAFGIDLGHGHDRVVEAFEYAFAFVADITVNPLRLPLVFPTQNNRKFKHELDTINDFIDTLIIKSDSKTQSGSMSADIYNSLSGIERKLLRDEIISLYFAGFETTARTMTFVMGELPKHPHLIDALRKEASGLKDKICQDDLFHQLPKTNEVINEALRLYPPVAMMARQPNETCTIDGFRVRKNSMIVICPFIAQRNEKYWPAGADFQPNFSHPLEKRLKHRGSFTPFGAGSRICLGKHFAQLELVLATALIVKNFNWRLVEKGDVELDFHGTLRPKNPIFVTLESR